MREPGPTLEVVSERCAGVGVLPAGTDPDEAFPPNRPMRFSFAAVARACEVSRSQVRTAFGKIECGAFLDLTGKGVALPKPLLRDHLELAIARQIIGSGWV